MATTQYPDRLTLRLPAALKRKLAKAAKEERWSQNTAVVAALEEWLSTRNGKP